MIIWQRFLEKRTIERNRRQINWGALVIRIYVKAYARRKHTAKMISFRRAKEIRFSMVLLAGRILYSGQTYRAVHE